MTQILQWLSGGDLRSDGASNEIAALVLENPELVDELYAGLTHPNDVVRARTADALEKVARSRPDLLLPHLPGLVALGRQESLPAVKMHLAMIFGHLSIYDEHVDDLATVLLEIIHDQSVFAAGWAITSLCIIARKYPGQRQGILDQISSLAGHPSIAMRSKVRNAVNILTNDNTPFPKGWVKSEHLKEF